MPLEVRSLGEWVRAGEPNVLSVVVPAHNEEGHIVETVTAFSAALRAAGIPYEILVINDNSTDRTRELLEAAAGVVPNLRFIDSAPPNGFGYAIRRGLAEFRGDCVAVVMADGSDSPEDLVAFHAKLREGYDCVFGTRFASGGRVHAYPLPKLILNRVANTFIRMLFGLRYNDVTNAFKLYRREVIASVQPILSYHFNLTVELPLKAIVRGYSYAVLPNSWRNRKEGLSKFKIREAGSRYMFIVLYCLLEKWLSRGDYRRRADLDEGRLQVWPR
jgi:dolichol-phosphate mannosyltransferase